MPTDETQTAATTLSVVGAGFGRTGTNSLKLALEQLGFGPCHHMFEVMENPSQLPFWQAAARGETPDWDKVFAGYGSSVDWPSARYWRELFDHFSDARVVLSVRPEDRWFDSVQATIYPSMRDRHQIEPGYGRDVTDMAFEIVVEQTFGGRLDDRDHALAMFRAHIAEVQATIEPGRLLTYDVAEGWEPLCDFLGVAVPDTPFPHANTTAQFNER
jgi:hypothetical protein